MNSQRPWGLTPIQNRRQQAPFTRFRTYRPAPGHREQLEKMLGESAGPTDTTAGNVLMQHLEGAAWTFLTIARYNSWDDFAKGEEKSVAGTAKKDSPWSRLREHADFHTDTLTDRIAP